MANSCDDCVSRFICSMRGTPCCAHNNKGMFIQMLYLINIAVDWEAEIKKIEESQTEK